MNAEQKAANTSPEKVRLHAIVQGYVQGVGFRMFVVDAAQRLGVVGWVRNRWDESVEVTAEGRRVDLERLLEELYDGPRAAHVDSVEAEWLPASGEYHQFWITQTY